MPLPSNGPLSLQGYSKPGDAVQSNPKQAMIVRMSAETLEALEAFPNQPRMDFEFGPNPGIYIGDTYFPMRPLKENSPHELYVRNASAAKPMVPLKLYANVTGKFTVERELDEKVKDKVRDRTLVAEKQRTERKAILLDQPLDLPTANSKKRKTQPSSMFRKPIPLERNVPPSSPAPPPSQATARASTKNEDDSGSRRRVIRCLAQQQRPLDEVVRLVGGVHCTPSYKQELFAILQEVAEQTDPIKKGSDKLNRAWRLKAKSWLEVRPYEWPSLSDSERTALARHARLAFNNMKIPESDPVWSHVKYRKEGSTSNGASPSLQGPSTAGSSTKSSAGSSSLKSDPAAKRGVSSTEVKDKKSKPKPDAARKAEGVSTKDESVKGSKARATKGKDTDNRNSNVDNTLLDSKSAVKRPGSGLRATLDSPSAESRRPSPSQKPSGQPESRPNQKTVEREIPPSSLPPKLTPSVHPNHERKSSTGMRMTKNGKERMADSDLEREQVNSDREKDKIRHGRIPRMRGESHGGAAAGGSDREQPLRKDGDGRIPRKSIGAGGRDSDREHERMGRVERETTRDRERDRDKPKVEEPEKAKDHQPRKGARDVAPETERERERGGGEDGKSITPASLKRKMPTRDFDDDSEVRVSKPSFQKKLRTDDGHTPTPSASKSSRTHKLDLSLPKKPDLLPPSTLPRQRIKKESSPYPPRPSLPLPGKSAEPSASSSYHPPRDKPSAKPSRSSKLRRKSPVFTSSEDEGEIREGEQREAVPSQPSSSSRFAESKGHPVRSNPRRPPSHSQDHAGLRQRYQKCWQEYILVYSRVAAEKSKLEALLNHESGTDSDGDVELVDVEELRKLDARHRALHGELLEMRKMWGEGDTDLSPDP